MDLTRIGISIRTLRIRRGWRQLDLADEAEVARSIVGRIERGELDGLTLVALDSVAAALGARVQIRLLWQGEALDRLLDAAHARLVEEVVRRLTALGWMVAVEVSYSRFGERGSIDVLAFHPVRRALVVIEVKSVVPDMQAMLGGLDRKTRLAPAIAKERGWDAVSVSRLLVLDDTRTNRRRLAACEATVRSVLPAGSRDVVRWLADPVPPAPAGTWFLTHVDGADHTPTVRHRVRRRSGTASTPDQRGPVAGPPGGP